jgi:hypothetical protein
MSSDMKSLCAWCGRALGTLRSTSASDPIITHGMCDGCLDERIKEAPSTLALFLDKLAGAVIALDLKSGIKTANRNALALLKKHISETAGHRTGDVLECANARLPGGCGKTRHCSGCIIRHTVEDTCHSGRSHVKTPAFLNNGRTDEFKKIDVVISTEKVGDVVLLRIDELGHNPETMTEQPS